MKRAGVGAVHDRRYLCAVETGSLSITADFNDAMAQFQKVAALDQGSKFLTLNNNG